MILVFDWYKTCIGKAIEIRGERNWSNHTYTGTCICITSNSTEVFFKLVNSKPMLKFKADCLSKRQPVWLGLNCDMRYINILWPRFIPKTSAISWQYIDMFTCFASNYKTINNKVVYLFSLLEWSPKCNIYVKSIILTNAILLSMLYWY